MGGDWPVGWEHLADLCVNCTPVVDPDTADLEYPTMPPDSVPISERDSDPYTHAWTRLQDVPNVLPPIPYKEVVWRRMPIVEPPLSRERDSDSYMVGDWVAQRFRRRGEPRSDSDLSYSSDGSCAS